MACEGERSSRPTSLLLEGAAPEREPLRFDVQLVGAPPEVEQLVNNIKQVAEDFLYHWKTFPIVLPQSRFSGPGHHPSDIIIAPSCDELDAAALDAGLEPHPLSPKQLHSIREKGLHKEKSYMPRKLTEKQLESIREWGEFEVPSRHFPGQSHVWRVAGWLQRGRQRAHDDLCTSLARAAALVVVVARDRLLSEEPLSIRAAARAMMQAVHRILDLLFGMPYLEARDLDKRIREERSRYLVAELVCKPEQQDDVAGLAAWVRRALRRAGDKDARDSRPPPAPHHYTTPQGVDIDLRLYRRETLRRLATHLQSILESESRGWFLHFRERLGAELARQKVPSKDIEEEVRAAGMREYVRRVCAAVARSEQCGPLRPLLEAQLQCFAAHLRAEEGVKKKLETELSAAEARIRAAHPILSRADTWRNEKLEEAAQRLRGQLKWRAMEDSIATLRALRLEQQCYFLTRDLAFLRDREPLLAKELRAAKTPMREFVWATKIWFPRNWVVTRHFRGATERIPTTLVERPTSIVTPRADPSQAVFSVRRDIFRRTDTRCPGWRLLNMQHRAWTWSWNMMFILGVAVPWNSPLSLRALLPPPFTPEVELSQGTAVPWNWPLSLRALLPPPFSPQVKLSQVNGTLFPQRSSETQTMWSRLLMLWRRVSKERTRFETEPDTGLLGKGLSRLGNRVWNYGVIGGLGSVALLLLFPPVALLAVALSLLGALLAPVVMPALACAAHVASALLFELDCVALDDRWLPLARAVLWRLGVLGALQLLGALGCALVLCPLAAALLVIGSVSWWSIRGLWERLTWRALLAGCARVPAHDSAFCRRVRGPHTPHRPAALELTAAQAVAGMCARAECEVLASWAQSVETAIERPLRDYKHFVDACFGPFSVQIAKTGSYKQLEKECAELVASLKEKVAARRHELALGLSDVARARVRMSRDELRRAIQVGSVELSRVWAGAAGAAGAARGDEWWGARALPPHDWPALAASTLAEVFDADILVPLEEGAARLRLEGGEGSAARRWRALCCPEPPDVLDQLEWWSWGTGLAGRVAAPSLDAGAFNPRARALPPVPPPSAAALVLYNRDADNPLPLEAERCAELLRALEDAPHCDERRGDTDRYRTLDSSAGSASPDTEPHDTDREHDNDSTAACRISGVGAGAGAGAACRWTLTGRGVRLRADLASPEDVTLDAERGTSV